ncbi:hypothetical protein LJR098_001845 [Rhizobium sp. LjRoot98]|nr:MULTISPECIES: hypothetical protein [unclassified Rhizobium]
MSQANTGNTAVVIIVVLPENAGLKQTVLQRKNAVAACGTTGV